MPDPNLRTLLLITAFIGSAGVSSAQFQREPLPPGGTVGEIVPRTGGVGASIGGGVFESTDGGRSWAPVTETDRDFSFTGNLTWAGSRWLARSRILRTPTGPTGGKLYAIHPEQGFVPVVVADGEGLVTGVSQAGPLTLATIGRTLHLSRDEGATWAEDRDEVRLLGGGHGWAAVRDEEGALWVVEGETEVWTQVVSPTEHLTRFIAGPGGGWVVGAADPSAGVTTAYWSSDRGKTWTPVPLPAPQSSTPTFGGGGRLYATTAGNGPELDGRWVSNDGGGDWTELGLDAPPTTAVLELSDGSLLTGSNAGVWALRGGGVWDTSSDGVDRFVISSLALGGPDQLAVSSFVGRQVWERTRGRWSLVGTYQYGANLAYAPDGRLLVAPRSRDQPVRITSDGGATWEVTGLSDVDALETVRGVVYARGTDRTLHRLTGSTWEPEAVPAEVFGVGTYDGRPVASTNKGIYRKEAGGWELFGLAGSTVYSLGEVEGELYASTLCDVEEACLERLQRYDGVQWRSVLATGLVVKAIVEHAGRAHVLVQGAVLAEEGDGWRVVFSDQDGLYPSTLDADGPHRLVVGSLSRGLFVQSAAPTSDEPETLNATHLRVWPNPTTGTATVVVEGEVGERVQLEVTDALGRTVARVEAVSGSPVALPSALAPGVYWVRPAKGGPSRTRAVQLTVVR